MGSTKMTRKKTFATCQGKCKASWPVYASSVPKSCPVCGGPMVRDGN